MVAGSRVAGSRVAGYSGLSGPASGSRLPHRGTPTGRGAVGGHPGGEGHPWERLHTSQRRGTVCQVTKASPSPQHQKILGSRVGALTRCPNTRVGDGLS